MLTRPGYTLLLACVPLLLTACSRDDESPAAPAAKSGQTTASVSSPALTDPRSVPPAGQPTAAPHPTAVVIPTSDPTAALNALTQAVRKFTFEKRQAPTSLEELATAGYVQAVPAAPVGKKYVINPKRMVVELVNL